MAYVLKHLYNFYSSSVDYSDPRSDGWFLIRSPIPSLVIIGTYLYFVCNAGPKWMKNRSPYNLKPVLIAYNLFQILANAFLLVYGTYWTYGQDDYKILCTPSAPLDGDPVRTQIEVNLWYCFYLLKLSDLLDTVFFVLKKQSNHISFLHVYHHACMIVASYIGTRYIPGGNGAMLGVLNCFVHSVMYGYYLYSVCTPSSQRSTGWKKRITQLQLTQFVLLTLHFFHSYFNKDCTYSKAISFILGIQNIFMMAMFGDFYRRTYLLKKSETKT